MGFCTMWTQSSKEDGDILEMPVTVRENRYVIVFVDYLTKWVEAYPAED